MKRSHLFLLVLAVCLFARPLRSQTYYLSATQEPYVSVGLGFPLTGGVWNNPDYEVPIGFDFVLFGDTISTLHSSELYGYGGSLGENFTNSITSIINLYGPDIIDRGYLLGSTMSAIYFAYEGEPGHRIFTQEWINAGFASGQVVDSVYVDYVNMQLKLYEETGDIEFRFGPSSITHPELDFNGASGPSLGLLKNLDLASGLAADEAILLSGDPANPVALSGISEVNLSGTIPENMVYRLSGSPSAVHTLMDTRKDPFFYPNPTTGEVRTNRKMTDEIRSPIQVYNMNGQRVFMTSDVNHLNLVGNPTGLYELRFQTDKGWRTERMCVVPE